MAVIQCDEHIPYAVVRGLKAKGIEAVSIHEENISSISDAHLLDYCTQKGRIILTNDSDFLKLAKTKSHSGIVYLLSQYTTVGDIIRAIVRLIDTYSTEDFSDAIFYIP